MLTQTVYIFVFLWMLPIPDIACLMIFPHSNKWLSLHWLCTEEKLLISFAEVNQQSDFYNSCWAPACKKQHISTHDFFPQAYRAVQRSLSERSAELPCISQQTTSSMPNKIKSTFDLDLDREATHPGKNKSTSVMPKDSQTWAQRELVVLCPSLLLQHSQDINLEVIFRIE